MSRLKLSVIIIALFLFLAVSIATVHFLPRLGTSIGAVIVNDAEHSQKQKEAALLATPQGRLAYTFAAALVRGDFQAAHGLLTAEAKSEWPPEKLQSTYNQMVHYFINPPHAAVPIMDMADWQLPERRDGDFAWVYTAIVGEGDTEAVTLIIARDAEHLAIRSIEWGRP